MSEQRNCQACKREFTIEPEDFDFYAKIAVPPPTWCPECRMRRRMVFDNLHCIYKRKCDATGKEIFSAYRADSPWKIFSNDYYWSDNWGALSYGREVDFSRPFLEQVKELSLEVPTYATSTLDMENSDYCHNARHMKNCYLVFGATECERCYYSSTIIQSTDCMDCFHCYESELCYESIFLVGCYNVSFSYWCNDSTNVAFSRRLANCSDCFGCMNLKNKRFHFFNEPLSEEEYKKRIAPYMSGSREKIAEAWKLVNEFYKKFPVRYSDQNESENCTGEYIGHSKDSKDIYQTDGAERSRYIQLTTARPGPKECYDYSRFGENAELVYECSSSGINIYNLKFSASTYNHVNDSEYVMRCHTSSDLFGCVGVRNKRFCILNKEYPEAEYRELVTKIKKHMDDLPYRDAQGREYRYGEFFPAEFSPFSYNETLANDFFPVGKEQVLKEGFAWAEPEARSIPGATSARELPDKISDVEDAMTTVVVQCEHEGTCACGCTKYFKILPQELDYYRRNSLPLPTLCFSCRHLARVQKTNPIKFYDSVCACAGSGSEDGRYENRATHQHGTGKCGAKFKTASVPEKKEIVYCEDCYREEIA
ncbi:MAG: hypothetical protein V1821_01665 [bacterium]